MKYVVPYYGMGKPISTTRMRRLELVICGLSVSISGPLSGISFCCRAWSGVLYIHTKTLRRCGGAIILCALLAIGSFKADAAIDPSSVVVLFNESSPDSIEIANYYAQVHPGVRLVGLSQVSTAEQVTQDHYLNVIRPQVLAEIDDSTELIVTTKGLPLRIRNTLPNPGTYPGYRGEKFNLQIPHDWWKPYSSLESELTRIDTIETAEQMGDQSFLLSGPLFGFDAEHHAGNPYYNSGKGFDRSDPSNEGIRLSARLDGFNSLDVIASIDRAQHATLAPGHQYVVVDDDPHAPGATVDLMSELVEDVLIPSGQDYIYDTGTDDITAAPGPVIGYVSHGSQAGVSDFIEQMDFNLAPGALLHTWESFNAWSFKEGYNLHRQGLVGEWLADGGTAALGNVQEPKATRTSVANEDILFDMLLRGHSFAEAAWAATAQLSFVNTVIGDPLMTFRPWVIGDTNLDGVLNITDMNAVLTYWNQTVEPYNTHHGELTGDGFVGADDLILLLMHWQAQSTNLGGGANTVPEPLGVSVFLCPSVYLLLRRTKSGPNPPVLL